MFAEITLLRFIKKFPAFKRVAIKADPSETLKRITFLRRFFHGELFERVKTPAISILLSAQQQAFNSTLNSLKKDTEIDKKKLKELLLKRPQLLISSEMRENFRWNLELHKKLFSNKATITHVDSLKFLSLPPMQHLRRHFFLRSKGIEKPERKLFLSSVEDFCRSLSCSVEEFESYGFRELDTKPS